MAGTDDPWASYRAENTPKTNYHSEFLTRCRAACSKSQIFQFADSVRRVLPQFHSQRMFNFGSHEFNSQLPFSHKGFAVSALLKEFSDQIRFVVNSDCSEFLFGLQRFDIARNEALSPRASYRKMREKKKHACKSLFLRKNAPF